MPTTSIFASTRTSGRSISVPQRRAAELLELGRGARRRARRRPRRGARSRSARSLAVLLVEVETELAGRTVRHRSPASSSRAGGELFEALLADGRVDEVGHDRRCRASSPVQVDAARRAAPASAPSCGGRRSDRRPLRRARSRARRARSATAGSPTSAPGEVDESAPPSTAKRRAPRWRSARASGPGGLDRDRPARSTPRRRAGAHASTASVDDLDDGDRSRLERAPHRRCDTPPLEADRAPCSRRSHGVRISRNDEQLLERFAVETTKRQCVELVARSARRARSASSREIAAVPAASAAIKRLAQLRRHLLDIGEDGVDVAVARDELRRGLLADPGDAGEVVGGIAAKRREERVVDRAYAGALDDARLVVEDVVGDAAPVVEHLHVRVATELVCVAVAGDDDDVGSPAAHSRARACRARHRPRSSRRRSAGMPSASTNCRIISICCDSGSGVGGRPRLVVVGDRVAKRRPVPVEGDGHARRARSRQAAW